MVPMSEDEYRRVLYPHADEKSAEVSRDKLRFAYYTNAATAYSILSRGEIWMRGTSTMNDYSEVDHGFDCLNVAYKSEAGREFCRAIDECHEGLSEQALAYFNERLELIRRHTFIACVSEHPAQGEDQTGRLSMWRAYGGNTGVAIVINPESLFVQEPGIGVYASPVAYRTQSQVEAELRQVTENVRAVASRIRAEPRDAVKYILFNMFRFAVLCTKHPGFAEEREWRVIACPRMEASPILKEEVEVIGGVPQLVQKLKLADRSDIGLSTLALPKLLNRIIIGPCEHPWSVFQALYDALLKAGISNPGALLSVSDIPLRTSA